MESFKKYVRRYGHRAKDYYTRDKNKEENRRLCSWCKGTGNELYSMYRQCPICGGLGYEEENDSADAGPEEEASGV